MYISIHINNNNLFTKNSLLQFLGGKGGGNIFFKKFKFNYFKFCIFMKFLLFFFYFNFFFGDLMNSKTLQRLKCSDLQNEAFTDNHSRGQFINAT